MQAELDGAQRELDAYLEAVSSIDVGVAKFVARARLRRAELDRAREALRAGLACEHALAGAR